MNELIFDKSSLQILWCETANSNTVKYNHFYYDKNGMEYYVTPNSVYKAIPYKNGLRMVEVASKWVTILIIKDVIKWAIQID